MKCRICGAENPVESKFCIRCGNSFSVVYPPNYGQVREEKFPKGLIVAIVVIFVFSTIVLPAILYIMVLGLGGGPPATPIIALTPSGGITTDWILTVSMISGGSTVSLADVYITIVDQNGTTTFSYHPLLSASGNQGFEYVTSHDNVHLFAGDTFVLSKDRYGSGTSFVLSDTRGVVYSMVTL